MADSEQHIDKQEFTRVATTLTLKTALEDGRPHVCAKANVRCGESWLEERYGSKMSEGGQYEERNVVGGWSSRDA